MVEVRVLLWQDGDPVLSTKHGGWWKYEFCYGKKVTEAWQESVLYAWFRTADFVLKALYIPLHGRAFISMRFVAIFLNLFFLLMYPGGPIPRGVRKPEDSHQPGSLCGGGSPRVAGGSPHQEAQAEGPEEAGGITGKLC